MRKMKINNIWFIALALLLPPFVISSDEPREVSYNAALGALLPISSGEDFANVVYDKLFLHLGSGVDVGVRPYAQMQVVYNWIPSYCIVHKSTTERCTKNFEKKEDFAIHGLWPADEDGNTLQPNPSRPCRKPANIIEVLKRLQKCLRQAMPSISDSWSDFDFWTSQWQKHGCLQKSLEVEPYFEAACKQWDSTKLLKYLNDAGIIPSTTQTYTRAEIENAITTKIGGVEILISCKKIVEGGAEVLLLYEIYVCVNKKAKEKVACKSREGDNKGCGSGLNIRLPVKRKN